MSTLQAGVSRVIITPPVGIYLTGMERPDNSHGIHDDLYATVLAVSDGRTELAFLSADILQFLPDLIAAVRQSASQQTGILGENILFCATHCHSAPPSETDKNRPALEQAYCANLPYLLIGAIRMAHDNLAPARLGFGSGKVQIGMNRRHTRQDGKTVIEANPDRPVDEQVGVIRLDTRDGKPLAVLVNYATHSVVLGAGSNVISRDWPGVMYDVVEKVSGAKCMFLQGASGDINPWPGVPTDSLDLMMQLGTRIGGEVVKVWSGIETKPEIELGIRNTSLKVPLEPVSKYAGKTPELAEWDNAAGQLTLEQFLGWLYSMGYRPQKTVGEGDQQAVLAEVQAVRLGETALVFFPGELFVKIGLSIKSHSPVKNTLVVGYANGCVGYVPLPEDYPYGGYEVSEAFYGSGLPAPIAPEAANLVEETALGLIKSVTE